MRNLGRGVIVGVAFVAACGGGAKNADTATAGGPGQPAPAAGASASAPAGGAAGGAAGAAAAQAATGKTWEVKMVGDASGGYKFDPANLTIKEGDAVKWTVVSGPPHNVSFYADSIPSGAQAQLDANMPAGDGKSLLTSPLFNNPGQSYTVSFKGVPKGAYKYFCTPHQALGMRAQLTVQ